MAEVFVSGGFDDLRSREVRFLQEAARLGDVTVLLWPDEVIERLTGKPPAFPQAERIYILKALRWVSQVKLANEPIEPGRLDLSSGCSGGVWVVPEAEDRQDKRDFCSACGLGYRVIRENELAGFPEAISADPKQAGKKVIVTGCFDWLHSGHIRFFEQAASFGRLFVSLGNDENIRQLKGAGHPLLPQEERSFMVGAVRFVEEAFVAAGFGKLDASAEIERIRPDVYVVNRDGDDAEKRELCASLGMEYVVLDRRPKEGLPSRQSTHLRG